MTLPALKFAVVREDPAIEAELLRRTNARELLVVASGGCTALALLAEFPDIDVTAFDINPRQLEHVLDKHRAALSAKLGYLNVDDGRDDGLSQCGEFERLFRTLRRFLLEFVMPLEQLEHWFSPIPHDQLDRASLVATWKQSKYWSLAFSLAFDARLLDAMFGPDATQHAAPGSYAPYFQRAFERALAAPNAARNPFLQHVLLGRYLGADAPTWMRSPPQRTPTLVLGSLLDVSDLDRFGLISLSNIFDWSSDALVESWARRLIEQTKPGTHVLVRQLNNQRDLRRFFAPEFRFDDTLADQLLLGDRSFFYERLQIAVRV
jgi:S-adenosylmethionine-diacylglycerol 3-amino-3-carboxypropyl transferase